MSRAHFSHHLSFVFSFCLQLFLLLAHFKFYSHLVPQVNRSLVDFCRGFSKYLFANIFPLGGKFTRNFIEECWAGNLLLAGVCIDCLLDEDGNLLFPFFFLFTKNKLGVLFHGRFKPGKATLFLTVMIFLIGLVLKDIIFIFLDKTSGLFHWAFGFRSERILHIRGGFHDGLFHSALLLFLWLYFKWILGEIQRLRNQIVMAYGGLFSHPKGESFFKFFLHFLFGRIDVLGHFH